MQILIASFVIAIDGPSAAGKGTLARKIAQHYDFAHLDTGALYRAVAYEMDLAKLDWTEENAVRIARKLQPDRLLLSELRLERIGALASRVSVFPKLRQALIQWQRDFAHHPTGNRRGAVLDGRDIGTVICPDAPVKFFVTASPATRAQRRCKELQDRGESVIYAQILQDIEARDRHDRNRSIAPLIPASDALLLDSSALDADEVFAQAKMYIDKALKKQDAK